MFAPLPWSAVLNHGDDAVCRSNPVDGRDLYDAKRPLINSCAFDAIDHERVNWRSRRIECQPKLLLDGRDD